MKVSSRGINLRLSLSAVLLFVVIRSEQVHCAPPGALSSTSGPDAGEPSIPPLIFPKDGSGYKVVENETALKILQSRAEAETEQPAAKPSEKEGQNVQQLPAAGATAAAVDDDESNGNNGTSKQKQSDAAAAEAQVGGYDENEDNDDDDNDYSTEDDDDNDEVEEVQPEDPNREDGLEEQFGDKDQHYPLVIDNTMIEVSAMRQEHVWVIMIGAIIVLAIAAYIGMVMYRNRLENRYGMRQRLVTEDDYYTNNDI
uniref:(northern house mosquito) hypothetical protein n=1 Tax=Culex pipiens TaxID=7175 RepID=A0A8D8CFW1_CULPI